MKAEITPKNVIFAFIAVMLGYVLYHNERFLVDYSDPYWQHIATFKWWLLPHGLAGAFVILLAPLQFSERLRRRFTRLHRVLGRLYVAGAVILCPLGIYIQYYTERLGAPRSFTVLAVINAVMLVVTTVISFFFAWRRRIAQHRQWMIRSYAIALVFIEGRFIGGITGWENLGVGIIEAIIWSSLAMSLLFADMIIHWAEIRSLISPQTRPQAAAKRNVPQGAVESI